MRTVSDPIGEVLAHLEGVKRTSKQWQAKCPAHEDSKASLSLGRGHDGRVLMKCFAGCSTRDVCTALGITEADLFASDNGHQVKSQLVATYDYRDETGELLYQAVRYSPKDFKQRRPDGKGGWIWNLKGVRRVLYRLRELIAADPSVLVFIVEGEKDVDRLVRAGFVATCNVGGAGKWKDEYAVCFDGRRIVVIADKDGAEKKHAGQRHARAICGSLDGIAAEVKYLELPGEKVKDAHDWFAAGGTPEQLMEVAEQAVAFDPQESEQQQPADAADVAPDETVEVHSVPWPESLADEAYHGVAGQIVRAIEPHTEADNAALLVQLLIGFGNAIGRNAYFEADGAKHYANLFAVLIGETAKGRKGTSWGQIHRLFKTAVRSWADARIAEGLASGEGLIWAVRDPINKREPIKNKGRVVDYQDVEVDPGVADKRLLVQEGEFAQCLKVIQREGNTLSPVIRRAWDTGTLQTLTKNSPATATDAHISIIGHITKDELVRLLDATESANGFANRFLWVCVRRSKCLPEGGNIHTIDISEQLRKLTGAVEYGREDRLIRLDNDARQVWHAVYPELSAGRPGLLGAVTTRAEAQVMRLAMIYALLDQSPWIKVEHLRAALAVWEYVEASARYAFGWSLGDRVADEILSALRATPAGLTRTELRDLFGRNKGSAQIGRALGSLLKHNRVRREIVATGGRSAERWFYAGEATTKTT